MRKSNKKHNSLTKAAALVLSAVFVVSTGIMSGYGYKVSAKEEKEESKDFAVVVKDKGLWTVDMSGEHETEIDKSGKFSNPKISPDGANVAYTKDGALYVSKTSSGDKKDITKVKEGLINYSWKDKDTLMYSFENGGLYAFNLKDKSNIVYISSNDRYSNMVYGKDGKIYCEKYQYYTKDGQQYISSKGIVRYDILSNKETTIVEPRDFSEEKNDMGLKPVISKISPDARYIYIWMKSKSGSTNADGVGVGVYDIDKGALTTFNNKEILALGYNDNIAISPIDNAISVLNNGGLRDMNRNKTLVMVNGTKGTWQEILPKDMISTSGVYGDEVKGITTMTPAFSPDGKNVIYSGAKATEQGKQWENEPHNIYSVNMENKKVEQITKGNTFDFAPNYIDNGKAIVFLRKVSDKEFQMFKLKDNKETLISKGIEIEENSLYYGHYSIQGIVDMYIGK